jgi:hypothetical protein
MVCEILRSICSYDGSPLAFSRRSLDRVAEIYFTKLTNSPAYGVAPSPAPVSPNPYSNGSSAEPSATMVGSAP